jgi:hypothetical protein
MGKDGCITMTVTVKETTGEVISVIDEYGKPAIPVDEKELRAIYESPEGFKYVGVMAHTHASPGCVYYILGGWAVKVCF